MTIITDEIIKITKNDTIYYTFKTFTPLAKDREFYNLIVYVNRQHEIFNIELLRYSPEITWLSDIKKPYRGTVAKIEHEITMRSGITTNWSFSGTGGCIKSVSVAWQCNLGYAHAPGEGEDCTSWTASLTLNFGPCRDANEEQAEVIVDLPSQGGGGGGTTPNGTPTKPTPPCKKVVGAQTIGITDGSGGCLENILPFDKALFKLTAEMTEEQTTWWNAATFLRQNEILNYINNQVDFNAAVAFAIQFIEQSRLNPGLNFDFEATVKSPYFIDFSSTSGNSPEEKKFRKVYNILKNSPLFKKLFIDVFEPTPLFNVKFTIEDIPQVGTGHTNGLCRLFNGNQSLSPYNQIIIDRHHLINNSDADVALTILHECIHAYLNIKFRNPTIGMSIENINNMDFQECINTYYNGFTGNQTQHSFFVENMIPIMVDILNDIKPFLISPTQELQLIYPTNGGAILYEPMGNPPTASAMVIPWNWDDFFKYFCYTGLDSSTAFPTIFPPNSNAEFIRISYINAFNIIFNP